MSGQDMLRGGGQGGHIPTCHQSPMICLQHSRSVSEMQNTTKKTKVKASDFHSAGLSGSESARQRFPGLLKVRDIE